MSDCERLSRADGRDVTPNSDMTSSKHSGSLSRHSSDAESKVLDSGCGSMKQNEGGSIDSDTTSVNKKGGAKQKVFRSESYGYGDQPKSGGKKKSRFKLLRRSNSFQAKEAKTKNAPPRRQKSDDDRLKVDVEFDISEEGSYKWATLPAGCTSASGYHGHDIHSNPSRDDLDLGATAAGSSGPAPLASCESSDSSKSSLVDDGGATSPSAVPCASALNDTGSAQAPQAMSSSSAEKPPKIPKKRGSLFDILFKRHGDKGGGEKNNKAEEGCEVKTGDSSSTKLLTIESVSNEALCPSGTESTNGTNESSTGNQVETHVSDIKIDLTNDNHDEGATIISTNGPSQKGPNIISENDAEEISLTEAESGDLTEEIMRIIAQKSSGIGQSSDQSEMVTDLDAPETDDHVTDLDSDEPIAEQVVEMVLIMGEIYFNRC